MGTHYPSEVLTVFTMCKPQGLGHDYMMYNLSREYIVCPSIQTNSLTTIFKTHWLHPWSKQMLFHHLWKQRQSLTQLTNALRILNHALRLAWPWISVWERQLESRANHDKYALFANLYNYPASSSRTKPDTAKICRMDWSVQSSRCEYLL